MKKIMKECHQLFSKRLFTKVAAHTTDEKMVNDLLSNDDFLVYLREYTQMIYILVQLQIKLFFINHVIERSLSMIEWLSTVSKNILRKNSINWDYPRTEEKLRHQQLVLEKKIQLHEIQFEHYLEFYPGWKNQPELKKHFQYAIELISPTLIVVLENELDEIYRSFQKKKELFQFDIDDLNLTKMFYDLNPSEKEIATAQKILRCESESWSEVIQPRRMDTDRMCQYDFEWLMELPIPIRTIIHRRLNNIGKRIQTILRIDP